MTEQTQTKAKAGAIIVPVTLFEQNCTIIWCEATKKAVVIDPGGDVPKIQEAIKQSGVSVEKIWLTHGHIDHVGGAAELRDALGVKIEGPHIADKYLLDNVGDVLFAGSVGRTDLPGGSHAELISSIKTKLLPLGDDIGFICGHGAGSSFGQERMTNPFLTGEIEG